jgi:hypothetical protein
MLLVCLADRVEAERAPQQVADAVAVAGRRAAESAAPRAVLLVLGADPDHASTSSPEVVRAYLRSLNVPLLVWTIAEESSPSAWGETVAVTSSTRLRRALLELSRLLDRQRIVWLEGAHLPDRVEVSPSSADWLSVAR